MLFRSEEPVDEVIVDRSWSSENDKWLTHSETGIAHPLDKNGGSNMVGTSTADRDSVAHASERHPLYNPYTFIRWRLFPAIQIFFGNARFDEKAETHYRKEIWFTSKVRV